ncbi:MAG TPA: DUF3810 family protein [Vicinamibacterales bacterium]|nr:DUF3810 family protein [Vicinamibacterales bacterium]
MKLARRAVIVLAIVLAIVPLPPGVVEASYSQSVYLAVQNTVTAWSNRVPVALMDIAGALVLAAVGLAFLIRVRADGFVRAMLRTLATVVALAALVYLAFFVMWGLNYRRLPLEDKIEFDQSRVTRESVMRLGERAVRLVNETHAQTNTAAGEPSLEAAFAAAQKTLGAARLAVPGVPKRSAVQLYFRHAAIDGMTDPIFLEIILNPDALPFERPFVTLHEWAHLAGYTNEAEANFVAWVACMHGSGMARYSGWMAIYEHVAATLSRGDRATLAALLAPGPRADLEAAAARYARSSPVVRDAARDVYDTYLRANRVREGIASYTGVVRLLVGSAAGEGGEVKRK